MARGTKLTKEEIELRFQLLKRSMSMGCSLMEACFETGISTSFPANYLSVNQRKNLYQTFVEAHLGKNILSINAIKKFFKQRPAISPAGICVQAGIDSTCLGKVFKNRVRLTVGIQKKILPILFLYGFQFEETK